MPDGHLCSAEATNSESLSVVGAQLSVRGKCYRGVCLPEYQDSWDGMNNQIVVSDDEGPSRMANTA